MHLTTSLATGRQRLGAALAVATLAAAALLAGCSDDASPSAPPTSAAGSPPQGMQPTAAELVQAGLDRLDEGLPDYAKPLFEQALTVDPYDLVALRNLARMAETSQDSEQALEYADRIEEAERIQGLFKEAVRLETSDLDESVARYRQVLEVNEQWAEAHMRLGFALWHQGEIDTAEAHLTRGIALDPAMINIAAPDYG